jgi:hypothetical protein
MAFYYINQTFQSFAVYADVTARDTRFFEANEGMTEQVVNPLLAQSSQRILSQIKNTDWWKNYQFDRNVNLKHDLRLIPDVQPDNIKGKEQEFKDLNIFLCLAEYLLPKVADFGNPESAEVAKMKFYVDAYNNLFNLVIQSGDWYDFNSGGTISTDEKSPTYTNRVRTR